MKELKNTASFIDVTGLTKSTGVNATKIYVPRGYTIKVVR